MFRYLVSATLVVLFALTGCASVDGQPSTAQRLAVQYATLKVIDANPERASRVAEIAAEARTYVADADASVAAVLNLVRDQIDWSKLDRADVLLVEALLAEIQHQLESRVGDGVLSPETRVRVLDVLDWVLAVVA